MLVTRSGFGFYTGGETVMQDMQALFGGCSLEGIEFLSFLNQVCSLANSKFQLLLNQIVEAHQKLIGFESP